LYSVVPQQFKPDATPTDGLFCQTKDIRYLQIRHCLPVSGDEIVDFGRSGFIHRSPPRRSRSSSIPPEDSLSSRTGLPASGQSGLEHS
jgi:hypothetical protein